MGGFSRLATSVSVGPCLCAVRQIETDGGLNHRSDQLKFRRLSFDAASDGSDRAQLILSFSNKIV
jgi:hypothetical protein